MTTTHHLHRAKATRPSNQGLKSQTLRSQVGLSEAFVTAMENGLYTLLSYHSYFYVMIMSKKSPWVTPVLENYVNETTIA